MITVYTKPSCPFCDRAKGWLRDREIDFAEVDVLADANALAFLKQEGHRTVPQVYYHDQLVVEGGYTGLTRLNEHDVSRLRTLETLAA